MKLVILICTFLVISVDLGLCQYDYTYGDYAYDNYYSVAPPPPRGQLAEAFRAYGKTTKSWTRWSGT